MAKDARDGAGKASHQIYLPADTDRRVSLRLSDAMYRELTLRKLDEGRPLNSIIIDAIKAYLKST